MPEMTLQDILASDIAGIRRPPPSVPPRIARPAALEPTAEHRHPWLATPRCRGLFELPRLAENFGRGPGSLNLQAHSLRHLLEDDSVGPARQDMRLNMVRARPEVWHRDAPPSNPAEAAPVSQVDDSEHEFLPDFNMVSHWQDEASLAMPPPSPRRWPVDRPLRPALRYARPVERLEHLAVDLPPGWPSPPRPPPPTTSDGFDDLNDLDDLDPPVQRIKPGYQWQARTVPSALFFQAPSSPAPRPYPPWPPRYDPFQAPPVDQFDSQLSSSPLPTPTPAPRPLTRPPQPASSSTQITTPPAPRQSPRRGCVTTSPRTHNTPSSQLSAYEHAKRRAQAPMYRQR
ncbi:hypothetical protein CC85DRAFT_126606 [Cutaneotrichosporon oleaginosum]|uniref:Uncharacterized protein n=1 Tax=Cutaneotrichosporon oleaginosum TaxID=879819 RepID=A0A0J0XJA2_9TREE|nr:uncharacterized protein CC85DRAFT_126606 [Cutaneotrichosporon oleaginosum]KLT41141.1 hypothetical protein CC85DRAFT_126606 [Cutaneotrichosporon oleaginosum]TXT14140.1 hypothetical protein COLE_00333 [Cutaneotrichosporon oleaginosum]